MSSGDDLDEDELLQRALKEQSTRDVNYRKPSQGSGKPVRNYVQPPANRAASGKGGSNAKGAAASNKQRKMSMDDDDDSDVEMLSISSGDEDDRGGGRGAPQRRPAGGGRDDDRAWDGEEPECWKHVNEAELARRVREMRESKAVHVAPKVEKPKGLPSVQSLPRGMEFVDPLGLGLINHKTFRLISDNIITNPNPFKVELEPVGPNDRDKFNYYSEKFDARLFVSRVHVDTSAVDLEGGALSLKSELRGRTQQKKELVKENFDCFVSCKTTIDDIETKMRRIEEDPDGAGTTQLLYRIQKICSNSNQAFGPLFERQAQTEKIRSVQGMLQRFRTLFNLPSTIRGSINKGEYDLAVREYRKAKSIVLPSHVGILKRVLEEVEKVIQEFKGQLYKAMEDPNIDLATLEINVRLLLELEPESDPIKHYLSVQNRKIRGLLEKCTQDYEAQMEHLQNELREKALSDAKWRQIQQDINHSAAVDPSATDADLAEDLFPVQIATEELDSLRFKFIRQLTAILNYNIPAFWKVALSVSGGKFAKSSQVSTDSSTNTSMHKTEDRIGGSIDEVAEMIRNTLSAYESRVLSTFNDFEEFNILCPYMSDAIKEISQAIRGFGARDAAPSVAVTLMRALEFEISRVYVARLCSWMRITTEEISKEESWVPVSILERNKSPYSISSLPLVFQEVIISAMDQIKAVLQILQSQSEMSEDVFVQLQEIEESVRLAFFNCFLDFAGHLEQIGYEQTPSKANIGSPNYQNGYSHEPVENLVDPPPGSITDPHKRLLMVLSNIGYCRDELSGELYGRYKCIWLRSRGKGEDDTDMQDLVTSNSNLEQKVLELYTIAKSNFIRSAAENYLSDAGIQWGAAPAVKGVRGVAVDLLHTLVAVHAEVFACCKPLLDKTLGILVEGLIDTFLNLFNENKDKDLRALDANGYSQLMLELEYFETILNPYFSHDAKETLRSLQGLLLEKAIETVNETVETPSHQRRATRGSDDIADDKQSGSSVSPDDLIALAQQHSSEFLQSELDRTRLNTACFVEKHPRDSAQDSTKTARASPTRGRGGTQSYNSPRNRRR